MSAPLVFMFTLKILQKKIVFFSKTRFLLQNMIKLCPKMVKYAPNRAPYVEKVLKNMPKICPKYTKKSSSTIYSKINRKNPHFWHILGDFSIYWGHILLLGAYFYHILKQKPCFICVYYPKSKFSK